MSDSANKPSREQLVELVKNVRDQAKDSSEAELAAPGDIGKALASAIREQVAAHEAELVKMRTLEVETLKKNLLPAPTAPAPMVKTVFDVLKSCTPTMKDESFIDTKHDNDPEKRLTDGNAPGSVTPEDVKIKEVPAEGSGGDPKSAKKSEPTIFDVLAKNAVALDKAGPKLGGSDPSSKMMTSHALAAGSKQATQTLPKVPGVPTPAKNPKPPTMEEHAARADSYADFMPKGKFGKAEFEGEECPYCHKPLKDCKCS